MIDVMTLSVMINTIDLFTVCIHTHTVDCSDCSWSHADVGPENMSCQSLVLAFLVDEGQVVGSLLL